MDWASILKNLLEVSPFVGLLGFLFLQERKERKEITKRLFDTLDAQIEQGVSVRRALEKPKKKRKDSEDDA